MSKLDVIYDTVQFTPQSLFFIRVKLNMVSSLPIH